MSDYHILLTTDLSDESVLAFAPTADLAARLGARITLFHAVRDPFVLGSGFPAVPRATDSQMKDLLREVEARLGELRRKLPSDLAVDVLVKTGEFVEKIVTDHAEEAGVDIIAMGTHGRSGLKRVIMGSVAEAVLRRSTTPVLLFPPARPG